MITIYDTCKRIGLPTDQKYLTKAGVLVKREWLKENTILPDKIQQKENNMIFMVFAYPDEFKTTIETVCRNYFLSLEHEQNERKENIVAAPIMPEQQRKKRKRIVKHITTLIASV